MFHFFIKVSIKESNNDAVITQLNEQSLHTSI